MSGSALMIIKGLAGDVVFSLKVFVRKEALKQAGSELGEGPESEMAQITQLAPLQLEMNQGIEGRQQPGTLPPEMVGMPSDGDPCLCAGAPLDPCTGRACAACTCATCCSAQRRSYTDALSTLYGVLSFREALWTLTGAPLASFAVFCLPVINFASIPAWYWLTGCGPTECTRVRSRGVKALVQASLSNNPAPLQAAAGRGEEASQGSAAGPEGPTLRLNRELQ